MSRSYQGSPAPGTEWWGRRPFSKQISPGQKHVRFWKRLSHKIERREWRKHLALDD